MPASSDDRRPRAARVEHALELGLLACAVLPVLIAVVVVVVLGGGVVDGASNPAAIGALVTGTLLTTAIALIVAVPVGLLAAIWLAEYASVRQRRVLEPVYEILGNVPTVVWGVLALLVLTPALRRVIPGLHGHNALSPGVVMGVMIAPMIASLCAEAIRAVPWRLREGALALGAGEAQTIFTIVLPGAGTGIVAVILLALSRALGETMIVTIAAGHTPVATLDPLVPIETLSTHVVTGTHDRSLFIAAASLFVLTLIANLLARRLHAAGPAGAAGRTGKGRA